MATYSDLKSQIADDLRRSDLTSQIATAVKSAIRDHSKERFWFNETRSYALTLTSGTSEYTLSAAAPVYNFIKIDWVKIPISGIQVQMTRIDPNEMEVLHSTTFTGQPTEWTLYADKLRVYPTPDTTYAATVAGHYRLTPLSSDSDTNAWTDQEIAFDLIRYSALKRLYAFPIRNFDMAQGATAAEELELTYLRREADRLKRTGQMAAYY